MSEGPRPEGPAGRTGQFARRTVLYAAGSVLSRSTGFILLPIFARTLTSAEFGAVTLAKVGGSLLSLGLCLGLPSAAVLKHFAANDDDRRGIYGALWLVLLVVGGVTLGTSFVAGEHVATIGASTVSYFPYLQLAIVAAVVDAALVALPREHMKASGKALQFVTISSLQAATNVILVVALMLIWRWGAWGAMLSHAASFLVAGVFGVWYLLPRARLKPDLTIVRQSLAYGLPLVPHFLSHWALNAADRLLISRELSLSDVAVYHVTYQIGSVVLILTFAGSNALLPMFGGLRSDPSRASRLGPVLTYFILGVGGAALSITALGPTLVRLLAGPSYEPDALLLPWLCLGFVFVAMYTPPVHVLSVLLGKSRTVATITLSAATVNVLANLALLPTMGLSGAAIATTLSYFALFVGFYFAARSGPKIPYEYSRILGGLLLVGVSLPVVSTLQPSLAIVTTFVCLGGLVVLATVGRATAKGQP